MQHGTERKPNLARRSQRARVVAVGEDAAAATNGTIDRSRDANRESLNAARERAAVVCLGNQLDAIILNRVFAKAKTKSLAPFYERPMNDTE